MYLSHTLDKLMSNSRRSPRGAPSSWPSNSHLSHVKTGVVFNRLLSKYDKTVVDNPQNEPISSIGLPGGIFVIA